MRRLSFLDTAFLLAERRETPMHVGGLHLFTLPEGVDEQEFLYGLADNLKSTTRLQQPFGDRLKMGRAGVLGPLYWEEDPSLDLDYHIRHSALPKPGRFRELFALVSRLHGTLLDRNRPLWEMHLIEGLPERKFAVYSKFHHAAIDGARSIHLVQSMYSTDPKARTHDSPLSIEAGERYRAELEQHRADNASASDTRRSILARLRGDLTSRLHLLGALGEYGNALIGRKPDALTLPWLDVPKSFINTPVDGARRFVAQTWPFARIRAVGKALDGSFNDAVLAMCAGALRMQMLSQDDLPEDSLTAMVPVSLRRAGDLDSANAVTAICADLATSIADPLERFRAIKASTQAGKELMATMAPNDAALFAQITQVPSAILLPLGLSAKFPPYSTTISNVPGPRQQLYWNGARLEGMYPASIVIDGMALNITLVTYRDQVDFGITACRRTVPQVQRFIDYLEEALVELETVAGKAGRAASPAKARKKAAAVKKAPAGKKTAVKKKTPVKKKASVKKKTVAGAKSTAKGSVAAPSK
jgi:WS/DGAT/MGAT family acyltransferase